MERKWSSGVTDEWQQRGRDNQRNGSISSSDKYLNFKGASADTGMWKRGTSPAPPPPPLLLLLLANHLTTLLYLGHSNVLLLPPLADALCHNPPPKKKIGRKEKKSEETVVKETRNFLPNDSRSCFQVFLISNVFLLSDLATSVSG